MACRYVLSSQYRPDLSPAERTHKVVAIVNKMVSMMEGVIQVSPRPPCQCCILVTAGGQLGPVFPCFRFGYVLDFVLRAFPQKKVI